MIKPKGAIESPLQFVDLIEKGLPLKALDRIATRIAPSDATFKYRIVPKATLARYTVRLNATQSTRVARLAGGWAPARESCGSDEDARGFLFFPPQLLGSRPPSDLAI